MQFAVGLGVALLIVVVILALGVTPKKQTPFKGLTTPPSSTSVK